MYQMESLLNVINKNKHIMALAIGHSSHMTRKISKCTYGHKDFFWLGFVVAAHKYMFHSVSTGSVGKYEVTKKAE